MYRYSTHEPVTNFLFRHERIDPQKAKEKPGTTIITKHVIALPRILGLVLVGHARQSLRKHVYQLCRNYKYLRIHHPMRIPRTRYTQEPCSTIYTDGTNNLVLTLFMCGPFWARDAA